MLTVERVMTSRDFADEGFDRPRWWTEGSYYTTLRSKSHAAPAAADLTSTTASATTVANISVNEIILHEASSGTSSVLVGYQDLIPAGHSKPLSIDDYATSSDKSKILIFTNAQKVWRLRTRGSYWVLDLKETDPGKKLHMLGGSEDHHSLMFAKFSPDATRVAFVRNHNIYVEDLATHSIFKLTHDGSDMVINGTFDWVYEEEFHLRDGFRWSPDGSSIAYWQIDQSQVQVVNLVNNTDSLYPKLIPIPYPKCGQTNPSAKIGIIHAGGGDTIWMQIPGDTRNNYLADLDFVPGTGELAIQQLNRLQNTLTVYLGKPSDGSVSVIFVDQDDAWVDIDHGLHWEPTGHQFIILSERDGWRRAYRITRQQDSQPWTVTAITPTGYDAIEVVGCDNANNLLYYIASPGDPLRRYLFVADYDGSSSRRVTPEHHEFVGTNNYSLSKDCKYAVHTYSCTSRPSITAIVTLPDHQLSLTLATNTTLWTTFQSVDLSPIEFFRVPITVPEVGIVELDAWCLHPPGFDKTHTGSYPVIFHVYGEPAAQIVRDQWGGRLALWHRMLAQRGAVVICIDNRGTPCPRGREWRKCVYRKVGTLGAHDQAAAVKKVLEDRQYIDPKRVGVWGWSGGGSMSLNALFRFPDIYQNAVVVAPVPDMRLYDTIYQERYMGIPADNDFGYTDGSPITFAKNMSDVANVLLIHGTGDDNCHYQGMERLINELIRCNKPFQMLAYPNRSHSICEGENTTRHLFESITRFWKNCNLIG